MRTLDLGHRAANTVVAQTLAKARRRARLSHTELAQRLDIDVHQTRALEDQHGWHVLTVLRWARHLGFTARFTLSGVRAPTTRDYPTDLFRQALVDRPEPARREWLRLMLTARTLVLVRHNAGLSDHTIAARLGVTLNTLRRFERNPEHATVGALQRYAAALGGTLTLTLHRSRHRPAPPASQTARRPPDGGRKANDARRVRAARLAVAAAQHRLDTDPALTDADRMVLQARIDHPQACLREIAAALGISKDGYSARLRRLIRVGDPYTDSRARDAHAARWVLDNLDVTDQRFRRVLAARADHPDLSIAAIGTLVGLPRGSVVARLRRAAKLIDKHTGTKPAESRNLPGSGGDTVREPETPGEAPTANDRAA